MAEVIGVAASAVTLAALFTSCIDCFSYFKAAQNCSSEAETLLVKLDCEKARLLVWANVVGILRTDPQRRYPQLADARLEILIRRCINQIIGLLTDAQKLQAEYGSRPTAQREPQHSVAVVSVNSMNVFKTAKLRFFARAGGLNEMPKWLSRIKWAIRDGAKFRILLSHLKDFVEDLIVLGSVPPEVINSTVEEDITTIIDIGTLRLAESACEESYPAWSARASEARKESEIGTLDRRNLEELIRDQDDPANVQQEPESNPDFNSRLHRFLARKTFIVLTDKCLDLGANGHCESVNIGEATSGYKDFSFCSSTVKWDLRRRILHNVELPFGSHEEKELFDNRRFEVLNHTGELPEPIPIRRIYIYCGPCACAIQTATNLIQQNDPSTYFDFAIRIDERVPTSCRRNSTMMDVLAAIHGSTQGHEKLSDWQEHAVGCIDSPELEKRIYNLDQGKVKYFEPKSLIQRVLVEDHQEGSTRDLPIGAIVIIVEADLCQLSLESRPFQSEARKPRETDTFTFKDTWNGSEHIWQRKSYSRSTYAIEQNRARLSLPIDPLASDALAAVPLVPRKRPIEESTAESES